MLNRTDLKKISEYLWEIPQSYRSDMRVPARIYATEKMLSSIMRDRSLEQLVNVATLRGIVGHALAMPDAHEGYGFPIGGVAATRWPDGVISPGGIGYDINCGVRLLRSQLDFKEVEPHLDKLIKELFRAIPSGVGRGGRVKLGAGRLDPVLEGGAKWAVANGFGEAEDLEHIESGGFLANADPDAVSEHAKQRGASQLGTLGAGNHFVEIDRVEAVYDETVARAFGLKLDQAVILIHTGSRGLGHQVATDYIRLMMNAMAKYGIEVPDRELAGVPFSSPEGKTYFNAMAAAANFAWANRQLITWEAREVWQQTFGRRDDQLSLLYDVAHNIAKIEEYEIDGRFEKLVMHRKGATRAFGPGREEVPTAYRAVGQPTIIPGSMGTASYVLVGTERAMTDSFGSACHGAGREMSRHEAKRQITADQLKNELAQREVHYQAGSLGGFLEEAPAAYKDIDEVVNVVHQAGIANKVAKLRPVAVMKG
jgi:tRNA-splicing ligase RtcB